MTQKDAMEGGQDPLYVDPDLFDAGAGREHSPTAMRAIADELKSYLGGMQGPGSAEGYTSGSVNGILDHCQLSEAQIGTWHDASAFSSTVGSNSGGKKFAQVYKEFIDAYKDVIAAVEASAANHSAGDQANEGKG
ncbi:hypothetical protein [Nonomuraea sp. NEAU-A123]|uniref:hypothetical protein n=1 Tax=Nonomuraea sp. NEAU-A123 TaxID=2839649 RepID=UPI001BE40F76|nr:hypothetical protein [Nonomuraea sp. NEAU-A123]MBT2224520.1 hypothetical protein [Nonomuraea sp. NEAU-A123]